VPGLQLHFERKAVEGAKCNVALTSTPSPICQLVWTIVTFLGAARLSLCRERKKLCSFSRVAGKNCPELLVRITVALSQHCRRGKQSLAQELTPALQQCPAPVCFSINLHLVIAPARTISDA
jgi:hypothetical protein